MWLRGIVPAARTFVPLEGTGQWRQQWSYGDITLFHRASSDPTIKLGSDGSGGLHAADPRIARVGWGSVAVRFRTADPDCDEVLEFAGSCGGIWDSQTVPRAETAGLLATIQAVNDGGDVEVAVDNAGVLAQLVNESVALKSSSAELWRTAQGILSRRSGSCTGRKVKSHAKEEDFMAGASVAWSITNEIADLFADLAAERLQVSLDTVREVKKWDGYAWCVLQRCQAVVQRCLKVDADMGFKRKQLLTFANRTKGESYNERHNKLDKARAWTQHILSSAAPGVRRERGGNICSRCLRAPTNNTQGALLIFLEGECSELDDGATDLPTSPAREPTSTATEGTTLANAPPRGTLTRCERLVRARHSLNALVNEVTERAAADSGNGDQQDDCTLNDSLKRLAYARQELANAKRPRFAPELDEVHLEPTALEASEGTLVQQVVVDDWELEGASVDISMYRGGAALRRQGGGRGIEEVSKGDGCHPSSPVREDLSTDVRPRDSGHCPTLLVPNLGDTNLEPCGELVRPSSSTALDTQGGEGIVGDGVGPIMRDEIRRKRDAAREKRRIALSAKYIGELTEGERNWLCTANLDMVATELSGGRPTPPIETGGLIPSDNNCPAAGLDLGAEQAQRMDSLSAETPATQAVGAVSALELPVFSGDVTFEGQDACTGMMEGAPGIPDGFNLVELSNLENDFFGNDAFQSFGCSGNVDLGTPSVCGDVICESNNGGHPTLCFTEMPVDDICHVLDGEHPALFGDTARNSLEGVHPIGEDLFGVTFVDSILGTELTLGAPSTPVENGAQSTIVDLPNVYCVPCGIDEAVSPHQRQQTLDEPSSSVGNDAFSVVGVSCLIEAVIPHQRQQTCLSDRRHGSSSSGTVIDGSSLDEQAAMEREKVERNGDCLEEIDRNRGGNSEDNGLIGECAPNNVGPSMKIGSSNSRVLAGTAGDSMGEIAPISGTSQDGSSIGADLGATPCGVRMSGKQSACSACGGPCGNSCYAQEECAADKFMRVARELKRKRASEETGAAPVTAATRAGSSTDQVRAAATTPSSTQGRGKRRRIVMPLNFGRVPDWLAASPSIGGVLIHSTHTAHLGWHRGLVWCWLCGRYATRVPINLRKKCEGLTESGEKHLVQLRQGKPPSCKVTWPLAV